MYRLGFQQSTAGTKCANFPITIVKDGGLQRRAESRALVDSVAHEITPAWDMAARTHFDDHRRQPEVGAHLRVRG